MRIERDEPELRPLDGEGALLSRAAAYARARGAPVLVRVHRPSPVADPWDAWGPESDVQAAWSSGPRRLLAIGSLGAPETSLGEAEAPGGAAWIDRRPEVPAAIGAFAFSERAADAWPGFGAGRLVLPRAMLWRDGGRSGVAYLLELAPGEGPAAALARIDVVRKTMNNMAIRAIAQRGASGEARAGFLEAAARARAEIGRGALEKVVLARATERSFPGGLDPLATCATLAARDPSAHAFAIRGAGGGWWLGATPELLVSVRGRALATVALAGTRARGASPEEDAEIGRALLASAKDAEEHRVVLDAILERLGPMCRPLEHAPSPRIARSARLLHLETPIRGTLRNGRSALEIARALHPTPAVAGEPRAAATDWIAREEGLARGWYAGPVGWVDASGGGELAVGLRALRVEGDRAIAYAGAGIVAGSSPEEEWAETEHKLAVALSGTCVRASA